MAKILVADDEPDVETLVKQRFRRQIRSGKYHFLFALNGKEALNMLAADKEIEMVLTDINMPEMDGLTLLNHLPQVNPLLKAVIVSAYGDMDNIRTAMNRGAFDFLCKPINFSDLEITIEKTLQQVAQLKNTLQAIRENNILKMYVDESVLGFMGAQGVEKMLLSNETIQATVAFFDICSFTSITEKAPADKVVRLLNNYFDVMVKEILEQDGHVDKFIGDAIMAVFRGKFHLDRAIEASLSVRNKLQQFPPEEEGIAFMPKVSVGIHCGEMICGNIGSANLKRLDYTVIGDVVNTAQRLQSAAQEGQILLEQASYQQVRESFDCKMVGELSVKNKAHKLVAYEVLG